MFCTGTCRRSIRAGTNTGPSLRNTRFHCTSPRCPLPRHGTRRTRRRIPCSHCGTHTAPCQGHSRRAQSTYHGTRACRMPCRSTPCGSSTQSPCTLHLSCSSGGRKETSSPALPTLRHIDIGCPCIDHVGHNHADKLIENSPSPNIHYCIGIGPLPYRI